MYKKEEIFRKHALKRMAFQKSIAKNADKMVIITLLMAFLSK